jgi:hypothetical protein
MKQFHLKLSVELVSRGGGGGGGLTRVARLFQSLPYQSLNEFKLREDKALCRMNSQTYGTKNHFYYSVSASA